MNRLSCLYLKLYNAGLTASVSILKQLICLLFRVLQISLRYDLLSKQQQDVVVASIGLGEGERGREGRRKVRLALYMYILRTISCRSCPIMVSTVTAALRNITKDP